LARFPDLKRKIKAQALSGTDVESIVADVVRLGGVAAAWSLAGRYHVRAAQQLALVTEPLRQARLGEILELILGRNH
jgi:hypothetical protein